MKAYRLLARKKFNYLLPDAVGAEQAVVMRFARPDGNDICFSVHRRLERFFAPGSDHVVKIRKRVVIKDINS